MGSLKSKKMYVAIAALLSIGGFYFVGLAGDYLLDYIKDTPANPLRHEYLEGMTLSLIFALPFWVLVAFFATPLKDFISKRTYQIIVTPALVLGAAFVLLNCLTFFLMMRDKISGH
jgi:hypothetical protein